MKYLHNDALSELTTFLTDLPLGGEISQRVLYGRLEAFSMKRGSDDKRYAFKLGEKFVASLETFATDVSALKQATRKRSQSAGVFEEMSMPLAKVGRRNRSCSFDTTHRELKAELAGVRQRSDRMTELPDFSKTIVIPSGLGNFAEQGTRRLMTDLILTLNMSFPDFDFAAVQPSDFVNLSVQKTMDRINKRLSDVALHKETFLKDLWTTIDSVMKLSECDVFCYQPAVSDDGDPMAFLTQTLTENHVRNNSLNVPPDDTTSGTESLSQPSITTIWSFNYFFVNKTAKRILLFTCVEIMKSHQREELIGDDDFAVYVPSTADANETDFDLDPDSAPAGGVSISLF
ncbi:hypothetical protein FisN_4Lh199 [Fistulifera solaris]|uniref:Repressor of RNA polymerase III transcription n=1 Tax=Fistulifera solaris TaxID=1519565 RepID=A0A1Z5JZD3_FISSO|nr:hypothetical protein FisN_4Lh199 [Fistulifera solaris]|eukprot:GAX19216.1 hypothetical protein FisN_4Lh199 [Fistulifera solaris]